MTSKQVNQNLYGTFVKNPNVPITGLAQVDMGYDVYLKDDLFDPKNPVLKSYLKDNSFTSMAIIVIDRVVDKAYGERISHYFDLCGIKTIKHVFEGGEENKNIDEVIKVVNTFQNASILRRSQPIFAIGGGVLLDVCGLACNLFRRGVPCIKIPTTLMAQIDASLGVKTGVNINGCKNRIGTYSPPKAVFIDTHFLKTVDQRHISNGLAELIKIGIAKEATIFDLIEKHANAILNGKLDLRNEDFNRLFTVTVQATLEEILSNPQEHNLQRRLDFGHNLGPMLEMRVIPELLHGEAVAIDMAIYVQLSYKRGLIDLNLRNRIFKVIESCNLPLIHKGCTPELLCKSLDEASLHRNGLQRIPLVEGVGEVRFVNDIKPEELENACEAISHYISLSGLQYGA